MARSWAASCSRHALDREERHAGDHQGDDGGDARDPRQQASASAHGFRGRPWVHAARAGGRGRAPRHAVLAHVGERPLAQVGRWRGPHDIAQQRRRPTEALELAATGIAAHQVTRDRRGDRRVPGHQPRQPIGLHGRQLELFEYLVVIHASPLRQRSGRATGARARYRVNSGPAPLPRTSRRRRSARRVRVLTVPSGQPRRSAISVCVRSSP